MYGVCEESQICTFFFFFLWFSHLLASQIFTVLANRGEFQLTSALERLRQEQGLIGIELDGERFDIGVPHAYLDTLNRFSQQ